MRFEQLSDHAGDQLKQTASGHGQAQAYAQYWEQQSARAAAEHSDIRRARPFWKRALGLETAETRAAASRLGEVERSADDARRSVAGWQHAVNQQGAGVAGEQTLASWLGHALTDDWIGFGGYTNQRGEADLTLVGPPGVWVVEVKNWNAQLCVNGDKWRYRKLDNYDNVVESGNATDRANRTWGQQASHVAEALSRWLGRNQLVVPVRTAVVLVHPKASVQVWGTPGVDLVTADPRHLLQAVAFGPPTFAPTVRDQVAGLIRRDHGHHAARRRSRT